jgi:hypothetical protein
MLLLQLCASSMQAARTVTVLLLLLLLLVLLVLMMLLLMMMLLLLLLLLRSLHLSLCAVFSDFCDACSIEVTPIKQIKVLSLMMMLHI